jgi:hypothetical protein
MLFFGSCFCVYNSEWLKKQTQTYFIKKLNYDFFLQKYGIARRYRVLQKTVSKILFNCIINFIERVLSQHKEDVQTRCASHSFENMESISPTFYEQLLHQCVDLQWSYWRMLESVENKSWVGVSSSTGKVECSFVSGSECVCCIYTLHQWVDEIDP